MDSVDNFNVSLFQLDITPMNRVDLLPYFVVGGEHLTDSLADKLLKQFHVKLPGGKRTVTVGAEVPVEYHRWMEELAASKDYPEYKTRSDIVRDCLHIGLSLRTDPRYRDSPELNGLRASIQALRTYEEIQTQRQTVDELVFNLRATNSSTAKGAEIFAQCEAYLTVIDDPIEQEKLKQAIQSYR